MAVAAGAAVSAAYATSGAAHNWIAVGLFALAFVVVQLLPVPIPHGHQHELVRFEEAVVVPLVLVLRPFDALLALGIGVLVGHVLSRAALVKTVFNVSQMLLATAACLAVVSAAVGPAPGGDAVGLGAAIVGLVAMFAINQVLVTGVMARAGAGTFFQLLTEGATAKAMMWCANAALGLLLVPPLFTAPWLLLVALVPLALLHASYRAFVERVHEEDRLRNLQRVTRGLTRELALDHTARQVVRAAQELVGAERAELRLREDDRVFTATRDGDGVDQRESSEVRAATSNLDNDLTFNIALTGRTGFAGVLTVRHERPSGPVGSTFTSRDRTLLEMLGRHAESALDNAYLFARVAAQRTKFAQIFEHSSEGLMVLNAEGRVVSWNPAMQAITKFGSDAVLDSPIALLSPQLANIPASARPDAITAVMTTADGGRRQVRASFAPIPTDDDLTEQQAWVVVIRDITAERETERMKDDFVATVSHELRTPLTAIKGFLETMRRDDVQLVPDQVSMFLEIMSEQSDRLERLINDLLDMSAIESGKPLKVSLTPVDLQTEVYRAVQAFQSARPEAELSVTAPEGPMMVQTDRHRLHQIINNLLENACKHAGRAAPIDLELSTPERGLVQLSVTDRGPGIAPHDVEHIFDRFYCTADSVTRNGGGAGLGLYICRKLLDAMHGSITVRSKVGHGSSFVVTLPTMQRGDSRGDLQLAGRAGELLREGDASATA